MKYLIATKPFKLSPCRYYGMVNEVGASRTIAFEKRFHAETFRRYMIDYRCKHHEWPKIDASENSFKHQICTPLRNHTVETVGRHVSVVVWDDEEIENDNHNINYLCCTDFDYTKDQLFFALKAMEIYTNTNVSQMRFNLEKQI